MASLSVVSTAGVRNNNENTIAVDGLPEEMSENMIAVDRMPEEMSESMIAVDRLPEEMNDIKRRDDNVDASFVLVGF
ncbi:hypothetical protein AAC387_Pa08g1647 [Persea americana]